MKIYGIICEYNPFHLGHQKQMRAIRSRDPDSGIVCLMSGNFVQRGEPAIFDKSLRARAAVEAGADLVLELPVQYALSSAEGFAAGGVKILSGFCDALCFGTETGDAASLMSTAEMLLSPGFSQALRRELDRGLSFPAARQAALGEAAALLKKPNDILGTEYCKAILTQNSAMEIFPILRQGDYHGLREDPDNPSATALREKILSGENWQTFLPPETAGLWDGACLHTLAAGERAVLARLRSMSDEEFEVLPYGSEGLWRKFMHACRCESTVEKILAATKSKRYTRTRLCRMMMCAFLGISSDLLSAPPEYTRVLALNESGQKILKKARAGGSFLHAGQPVSHADWRLEQRCTDLYGLFSVSGPEAAGMESRRRIFRRAAEPDSSL